MLIHHMEYQINKIIFSEGIKNSKGEDISTIEVKKTLENIIESEEKQKPLTDDQLTKLLNKEGYPIARRTVAKYQRNDWCSSC